MRRFEPSATSDEVLFRPIEHTGPRFWVTVGVLGAIILFAVALYVRQVTTGLRVTGMAQPVTWGFYIVNFVFFIGISHAGTLISAILRITQAEWRRPITRMAEVITAIVLAIGGLHPIIDLGRPDRVLNVFLFGRLQSPLLWDVTSISAYFAASTVYLFLPLIPDIALLRERGKRHRWLYRFLSWGWQGTPAQWKVLSRAVNIMMIVVVPIAVSVHTVISYIFAMTLQTGWHSTIFGPYFVIGAIFSGIAALFIAMIAFRSAFRLQAYLKLVHFQQLAKLLLVMSILWAYFTFCEYLTGYYGGEPAELKTLLFKVSGPFAPLFWTMIACNFVIPVFLLSFRRTRTIAGILVASIGVLIGMWLERLIIVVPSLQNPRMPFPPHAYVPSLTEVSLFVGALALFALGFTVFSKFFPIVSVWEVQEGRALSKEETIERLDSYLPDEGVTHAGA
ncbi:MAG: NrfD/PsrC family molybdoenzyme membrane anchor subunit [bacterium]